MHADGDYYGRPFRLRPFQAELLARAYELRADGTRRYDRVVVGLPKGNGKTELAAAIAVAELAGPVVFDGWDSAGAPTGQPRLSPDIPVAAASFEQANLVYAAARAMLRKGALAEFVDTFDTEVLLKERPGRLYRVAAIAGTNDGLRPTFFVADELHEWTGPRERVYLVLQGGRAKRRGAWQLVISTAGWAPDSLLGQLYAHGKRVLAGEETDDRFLFVWCEADATWDLKDPAQLEQAIRQANPAAGDFLPLENLVEQFRASPEFEARRYHLNQWTAAPARWLPAGAWDRLAQPRLVADGTPIAIGFDGSYSGDSTAVVGCTTDGYLFVLGLWEKPARAADDWRVELDTGWDLVGHDVGVQGNLDPAVLLGPPALIRDRVKTILDRAGGRPGHIFNLGHGVHRETPVDHVRAMVDLVHELSDRR